MSCPEKSIGDDYAYGGRADGIHMLEPAPHTAVLAAGGASSSLGEDYGEWGDGGSSPLYDLSEFGGDGYYLASPQGTGGGMGVGVYSSGNPELIESLAVDSLLGEAPL